MTSPPTRKMPPPPPSRKPAATKAQVTVPSMKFAVSTWAGDKEGEKIIVYADSGMGKTTLASMAPRPVFIGLDDGGRKIRNPLTGENLQFIDGVNTFDDFRAVLQQRDLFADYETVVVDTGTLLEDLAHPWTFANVKAGEKKSPYTATNIEDYGWGKGYRHLYDTMKLPLADFDVLVRQGKNVIILCQMAQVSIANAGGEDFLCDVPKLQPQHGKTCPAVWSAYNEWADHVFKIGYENIQVSEGKAAGSGGRAIYAQGQPHFKAKSRTIPSRYPVVSFSKPSDDTIWRFVFDEAWKELEENE